MTNTTTDRLLSTLREMYRTASPERRERIVKLANAVKDPATTPATVMEIARISGLEVQDPIGFRQLKCLENAAEIKEKRRNVNKTYQEPADLHAFAEKVFNGE